jgi:hypothetical protein
MPTSPIANAEWSLMKEFRQWANKITEREQADFFDPRNRDQWMRSFADYLARPREFASND